MKTVLITGSAGLIGSECSRFFHDKGFRVIGIDNDMRAEFFGKEASIKGNIPKLENYEHWNINISQLYLLGEIEWKRLDCIIHAASQTSHDWAGQSIKNTRTDFEVNAFGTFNLLQLAREHCPEAPFIFCSSNKVYGDNPNKLHLIEKETRYELPEDHPYYDGIPEIMGIDYCTHSLFGCSKTSADLYVQEYGRYFNMPTVCFRGGCLTGSNHKGAELHGFLAYLTKCIMEGKEYIIYGYKGKQVRDNIHAEDVASAFWEFYQNPKAGAIYNIGGERENSCSIIEATIKINDISKIPFKYGIDDNPRKGDHIWYITNMNKFKKDYPNWEKKWSLKDILTDMVKSYKSEPATT